MPNQDNPAKTNIPNPPRKRTRRWRKIILWSITGIVVLVIAVVITGVLLLEHNPSFRQYVLNKVTSSIAESTGAKIEVRDFDVHLSTLSVNLHDVKVHGTEPDPNKPLLQTDRLGASIKILSLFRRTWRLQDVEIDHPVVRFSVNKAGENNLPKSQKQSSSSNTNIFDLAIQKFVLGHGEIYYNDKKSVLDAELHDLNVNAAFDNFQSRYYGDLGYKQGRIQYGKYAPMVHDLQAHFNATPKRFDLDQLVFSTGASHLTLKASAENYSDPNLHAQANYDAVLVADDFKRILKDPTLPTGTVLLNGSLTYQADPNRPPLETVSVQGQVSSRSVAVNTPSFLGIVQDFGAQYQLANGNAEVRDIHARLLGGTLNGKLTIRDLSGKSQAKAQASLKDVSIDALKAASRNRSLEQADLHGKISADANATWAKTLDNLVTNADATIQAALGPRSKSTPLNGAIHARYAAANKTVALNQSYIKTPQTSVTLNGEVSNRCQLQVNMQSNDLHELELLAANFSKPTPGQPQQAMGLYGKATLTAAVTGSTSKPEIRGQLAAQNLKVKGTSWKVLKTNITANPSLASLTNGDLEAVPQGHINFNVETRLTNWSYTPSSPINVQVSAAQLSVADLARLANQTVPATGTLSANISLHGSQLSPVGQGNISLANGKVSGEPIQALNIKFKGTGDAIDTNLLLKLAAGATQANVVYHPKTEAYEAELHAANLRIEKLHAIQAGNQQINGGVTINVSGRGTIKSPELTASIEIPQLQIEKQTIRGVNFTTNVRNHLATINLSSQVVETYIKASGTVGIDAPYNANLQLDTGRIQFEPLLAMYAPAQAGVVSGQTELHATLRGPLQDKTRLEAHIQVPVLTASYKQLQFGVAKPIRLDYQNGIATLQPTAIQGTGTDIQMQGSLPLASPKAASLLVQGTADLRIIQLMQPDLLTSGQLKFDINSQRFGAGSNVQGQIRLVNANVHTTTAPLGLDNANGVFTVTQERLEVTNFEGQVGGGTVTAKGGVAYRPGIQFDLALAAKNVRVRYPDGVRVVAGSNLALTGNTDASLLRGQVNLEHVSFTPDFDMSTFINQFSGGTSSPPDSQGVAAGMKLDIAVQSTSQMNLVSSKVSIQGSANLRVVGTAADPVILGRTDLTGGELFVAGNRYIIQQGTINFLNPIETEPVVNLRINTTVNQYNIALNFQGPVSHLQTTYTSDPALPPVDIINLLAFGKTTEASAAGTSAPGTLGAQSVLASGISSAVSNKVEKFAGLSHLSIDPVLGSNQQSPGARIAIQQRVTSNLFVTFATDVTSTQHQAIQLEYKLNPRWSVSGVRDQNGGFGVDGKYHKTF
ncbi:MAG TPA: translocation/assembly module TamB domain-containing protein [Candidatus Angelobacter sp.]|jgi:translocation and assembly module TamB|nr:translocation/assembly module TamB domain-containing protein [Candidatus Angelobacter sp.]